MARPYGVLPRDPVEAEAWPVLRSRIFKEATEIMLRLLKGESISSDDIEMRILSRDDFRSDEDWQEVLERAKDDRNLPTLPDSIPITLILFLFFGNFNAGFVSQLQSELYE